MFLTVTNLLLQYMYLAIIHFCSPSFAHDRSASKNVQRENMIIFDSTKSGLFDKLVLETVLEITRYLPPSINSVAYEHNIAGVVEGWCSGEGYSGVWSSEKRLLMGLDEYLSLKLAA